MIRRVLILAGCAALLWGDGRPALLDAARNNDRETVRALIQKKADVNAAEADGSTALLWASYHDDAEAAALLLGAGANANAANDLGVTPLWAACQNGNAAIVRALLAAGANPNAALLAGETPLMVAARSGHTEAVALLLAGGANPNARASRGQTALMWAAAQRRPGAVRALLAAGADVHARSDAWSQMMAVPPHGRPEYNRLIPHGSNTALLFAARSGDLESAELLVAAGANVNDRDAWGVSALVLAAHSGFANLAEFLLARGAEPNSSEAGFAALHAAVMRRDERTVKALLAFGADPNAPLRVWTPTRRSSRDFHFPPALVGATPFWLAARYAQPEVMRLLVKHGADPKFTHRVEYYAGEGYQRRSEAATALMAVAGMGGGGPAWVEPDPGAKEKLAIEAARLALELGVDINAAGPDERTALDGAKSSRQEALAKFLAENGAKSGAR